MFVRLGQFVELGFQIETGVSKRELAQIRIGVRFDVGNPGDVGQFASNRGGTPGSRHPGQLKSDDEALRRWGRSTGCGMIGERRD